MDKNGPIKGEGVRGKSRNKNKKLTIDGGHYSLKKQICAVGEPYLCMFFFFFLLTFLLTFLLNSGYGKAIGW